MSVNDGSEANMGTVSAREGTNTSLEVSIVSGVSRVSVSASVDAGMDQNNNSNDITTNNKYPKAQRHKHNNIAPAAVGPWAQPNCTTIRSMTTFWPDALQYSVQMQEPICILYPLHAPWITTGEGSIARGGCIAGAFVWRIQQWATQRLLFPLVILPMIANAKVGVWLFVIDVT